ncbi:hypothetical protein M3Y97_00832400 [Aphelenchoides bicaudatus]|nr:hypothetical protein M3Y97_00832400 [Aphelenchoides bicaudatus]
MALIFASSINKRMNAPRQKRSLGDASNGMDISFTASHCRQRSNEDRQVAGHTNCAFDSTASGQNRRKRSTSQNSCSNSSCCQTPPPNGSQDFDQDGRMCNSMHASMMQQSIHRSKTSAGDHRRKLTTIQLNNPQPAPRKISTPLMSASVIYEPTFKQHSNIKNDLSMKKDLRKALAKKRMVKENHACREELAHLAVSDTSDLSEAEDFLSPKADSKHRRSSFDNGKSDAQKSPEKRSPLAKQNAFQQMCNRLKKWTIHTQV